MSALTRILPDSSHASLVALVAHVLPTVSFRHHGIGVLQGYVLENYEPETRIHVWDPELVKPGIEGNGDVHDHRFDMVSRVLLGSVVHEEWHAEVDPNGQFTSTLLTHARAAASSKYHGPTTETGERFSVRKETYVVPEGYRYTFPAGAFHRSPVTGLAVTLVEKWRQRSAPARILHPVDAPFVPAFGHDEDYAVVSRVLRRAVEALEESKKKLKL